MLETIKLQHNHNIQHIYNELNNIYRSQYGRNFKEIFYSKQEKLKLGELTAIGLWDKNKLVGYLEYEITINDKVSIYTIYTCMGYRKVSILTEFIAKSIELLKLDKLKEFVCHLTPFKGIPLKDALQSIGFRKYKRYEMRLLLSYSTQTVNNYSIKTFSKEYIDQLRKIMVRAFYGSIDHVIYSEFFTDTGQKKVLDMIQHGAYGVFLENCSLLMFKGNKLIGYGIVTDKGNRTSFLMDFAIDPEYQGMGLSVNLLNTIKNKLIENNYKYLNLAVTYENSKAFNLYTRAGFKIIGKFDVFLLNE